MTFTPLPSHNLLESLETILQEEINIEILCGLWLDQGWHKCTSYAETADISQWAAVNCNGDYRNYNYVWLFFNVDDAALFKLTWQ